MTCQDAINLAKLRSAQRNLDYAVYYDNGDTLDWRLGYKIDALYNLSLEDRRIRYIVHPDGFVARIGV